MFPPGIVYCCVCHAFIFLQLTHYHAVVISNVIMETVGMDLPCVMVMMTVETIVMKLDVVVQMVQVFTIHVYNVLWVQMVCDEYRQVK